MRTIDFFIRGLTFVTAIGCLFLPGAIAESLISITFFAVGLWALLFPPGILGWAKITHGQLDPLDRSIWWIPKFIGAAFMIVSFVLVIARFK